MLAELAIDFHSTRKAELTQDLLNDVGVYAGTPLTFARKLDPFYFWEVGWQWEHGKSPSIGAGLAEPEERKRNKVKEQRRKHREEREERGSHSNFEALFDGLMTEG